jgi:hypothetical protein
MSYKHNGVKMSAEEFAKLPRNVRYECPTCTQQFSFRHDPGDCPPPSFCALCGAFVGEDPSQVMQAPHIQKSIGKVADAVYRDMESSADYRIEQAAEMTGMDASDLSAMKVTDLKDNLRAGDVAAILPENPVSQAMTAQSGTGMIGHTAQRPAIQHSGTEAYAGARAMATTNAYHQRNASAVVSAGQTGKG